MIFEIILEIRWIMEGIFCEIFEKERGSIINLESTYPCLYIKFHPFEPMFDFRMDFRTLFHVKTSQISSRANLRKKDRLILKKVIDRVLTKPNLQSVISATVQY